MKDQTGSVTPVRDWWSEEVTMEDSEESRKISCERASQHLEVPWRTTENTGEL